MKSLTAIFSAAVLLGACTAEPVKPDREAGPIDGLADAGELSPEGTSLNGTSLNGTSLNGTSLNGTSLNGTSLNGMSLNGTSLNGTSLNGALLNGTSLNGTSLNGVALSATSFSGKKSNGSVVSGADFVGTLWSSTLSSGAALMLRIDSRTQLGGANADVYAYGVSYQTDVDWVPLCGTDVSGAAVLAVPLAGTWNYDQGVVGGGGFTPSATDFTFACRGTAIAKCVELGYKPWKTAGGVSLQNHLTACTRMLRADYCGDGTSYTVDGTPINLYDNVGVQADTEAWYSEAEWTADGARFVSKKSETRLMLSKQKPPCFGSLVSDTTGQLAHFATGTLLMNEYKN